MCLLPLGHACTTGTSTTFRRCALRGIMTVMIGQTDYSPKMCKELGLTGFVAYLVAFLDTLDKTAVFEVCKCNVIMNGSYLVTGFQFRNRKGNTCTPMVTHLLAFSNSKLWFQYTASKLGKYTCLTHAIQTICSRDFKIWSTLSFTHSWYSRHVWNHSTL